MGRIRRLRGLVPILTVAVTAALALVACGGSGSSASSADVRFISPKDFHVSQYAGRPLVINFFGSWCGPCNMEAPDLAAFARAHRGDAAIVGVAVNDQEGAVVDFMNRYGLNYPVVLDDGSLDAENAITGVPTTIFYNAAGQEVDRIVGASVTSQFDLSLSRAK